MDWKEVLRRRLATPNTCPNKIYIVFSAAC
ncbi:PPP2R3C isoform 15 [Pongo abelii]|uniref:PPP2R3C isoform 15 n=1 Tax=Pongo abelii TaxID=9601 RepID=A0A2J8TI82_PONAB|nr:PPP2R3C isoform 15 [Pongo abelii]